MLLEELLKIEPPNTLRATLLAAILRERSDLCDKEAHLDIIGNSSYVVFVGDEVFKGPRWSSNGNDIKVEIKRLSRLQHSPYVPKITHVGRSFPFYGMEFTRGWTMSVVFNQMSSKQRWKAAEKLGCFMAEMAAAFSDSKPLAQSSLRQKWQIVHKTGCFLRKMRLHFFPSREDMAKPFTEERAKFFLEILSKDTTAAAIGADHLFVRNVMTNYLQKPARKRVVFHCDLHDKNILSDGKDSDVFTVIDFGRIYSDLPENSLQTISDCYGEGFARRVWRHYARADKDIDVRDYGCRQLHDAINDLLSFNSFDNKEQMKRRVKRIVRSLKAIEKVKAKSSGAAPCP